MIGKLTYHAWTRENETVYTLNPTASDGDALFTAPNIFGEMRIVGSGFGYIEIGINHNRYDRDNAKDVVVDKYRLIVTPAEMASVTRLEYTDPDKLVPIIREVERMNIRPLLGTALYMAIVTNPPDSRFDTLLDGGTYETTCGLRAFDGLRTAAAYYAFARSVKSDIVQTRYGNADKRSEHSYHSSLQEKQKLSRETNVMADRYMQDCLNYIFTATDFVCPCDKPKIKFVSPHSLRFNIIDGERKPDRCRACRPINDDQGGGDDEHTDFNNDFNNDFD